MPRMGQVKGQGPVVGDNQQPFAVLVKPPHGIKPFAAIREVIKEGFPSMGILTGAEHSDRFVEHVIKFRLREDAMTVYLDGIGLRIKAKSLLGDGTPIHRNPAVSDILFAGAPGGNPAGREIFLKTNRLTQASF